jgi:2-amino-4-hydroxy-6-hydroxymethyldihydropteridine diphosphokinase
LGNKEQNIVKAVAAIGCEIGVVRRVSDYFQSEAHGFISKNKFLNIALLVLTDLTPLQLLSKIQDIELKLGRTSKSSDGYTDRLIDIDILLYDNEIVDMPELKIPHPLMLERDFVLVPLREIAPELSLFK